MGYRVSGGELARFCAVTTIPRCDHLAGPRDEHSSLVSDAGGSEARAIGAIVELGGCSTFDHPLNGIGKHPDRP